MVMNVAIVSLCQVGDHSGQGGPLTPRGGSSGFLKRRNLMYNIWSEFPELLPNEPSHFKLPETLSPRFRGNFKHGKTNLFLKREVSIDGSC